MTNYFAYLQSQSAGSLLNYGLGDWYDIGASAEGYEQLTPLGVTASAYFYQDAQTLAQIATELGNAKDAAKFGLLATNIAAAFNGNFYSSVNGYYASGSQTAQAMPLELGMVNPTNQASVLAALISSLESRGSTSGEIGHRYVLRALTDAGRPDVAFNLNDLTNSTLNPGGYGYMLSQGATSATEAWNADPGDSLDHFMWGHIVEWFYHDLAGIQSDPSAPGFRSVIIKPAMVGDLTWVNASYNSIVGMISSSWILTNATVTLNVSIPCNATGRVYLPTLGSATNSLTIQESGVVCVKNGAVDGTAPGVTFDHFEGSASQTYAVMDIGSGTYQFTYAVNPVPTGLTAVAGNGQVVLNWNVAANASGYNVKRSNVSGGPYTILGTNQSGTNFTDATVVNGATYYYVVSAVGASLESFNSLEVGATPAAPAVVADFGFETPEVGSYAYNPAGIPWAFTPLSGTTGSGIAANASAFTSLNQNAPQGVQVAFLQGLSTISQTISNLIPGANYIVTFYAAQRNYQQNGGQTWNVAVNGSVIGNFAPARSATNYAAYSSSFNTAATNVTLAFIGTDLSGGDNTVFLDEVEVALGVPPASTGIAAAAGNGFVSLTWNAAATATSYNIFRATSNSVACASLIGSATATNFVDLGVTNRAIYYYFVSAVSEAGQGSNSAIVFAVPGSQVLAGFIIGSSGSWDNLGNTIANAFDGNLNTFYDAAVASGDWVGLDFGSGVSNVISTVGYCPRSDFSGRMTNGVFQAANNSNFSNAMTLLTITNPPSQSVLTIQAVGNTNSFRYVRYVGPSNGNCNVAELQFDGWNSAIPSTSTAPPLLSWQMSGRQFTLGWPVDHVGWTLQIQTNGLLEGLTTNWITVMGSPATNQISVPLAPANMNAFFRLRFP